MLRLSSTKSKRKLLALFATFLLLINSSYPVFAQEIVEVPPEPLPSESSVETPSDPPPEPTPEPLPESVVESPPEPTSEPLPEVIIDNVATASSDTSSTADTGQNTQVTAGSATTDTGEALAIANSVNDANTTLDQSQLGVSVIDDTAPGQTIDLTQTPPSETQGPTSALVSNDATLIATTSAIANTGNNITIAANDATLTTQNATAVANAINLINLILQNTQVIIFVVNIYPGSDVSLILPRPETYAPSDSSSPTITSTNLTMSNQAELISLVSALTNTGNNTAVADNLNQITTGDAYALSQQLNLVNVSIDGATYFLLTINHPYFDFVTPAYLSNLNVVNNPGQTVLSQGSLNPTSNPTNSSEIISTNQANAVNVVTAIANTGNNYLEATNTSLFTGISTAIANTIQFINTQITNSRIFIGIINFLGSWTGQANFNYPDVEIMGFPNKSELYSGESLDYSLTVVNRGHDIAHEPQVQVNYGEYNFNLTLSDLAPTESQSVTIPMVSEPTNNLITASVAIPDPEVNLENNQINTPINILEFEVTANNSSDDDQSSDGDPKLEITAINNVVDPVFPGDTVTFEINIKNTSDYSSLDNMFYHILYDQSGKPIGDLSIPLGNMKAHSSGTLRFGITVPNDGSWSSGLYSSESQATGFSSNNLLVSSNIPKTIFSVFSSSGIVTTARAADNPSETILGLIDSTPPSEETPLLAYVLTFLLSCIYLLKNSKVGNFGSALLYGFAFLVFLFASYEIATLTGIITPVNAVSDNYQYLSTKLKQFL